MACVKGDIDSASAIFFLCDMQERFKPAIKYFDEILTVCIRLVNGANAIGCPIVVTEQYPKGLGATVPELQEALGAAYKPHPKTKFSMVIPEVEQVLDEKYHHVVLFGIETHVCIQQTAIDLIKRGKEVYVIADACSSRSVVDRQFAFERLRGAGAILTTAESVLLQLIGSKDHPNFKEVQQIIKDLPPCSGLVPHL